MATNKMTDVQVRYIEFLGNLVDQIVTSDDKWIARVAAGETADCAETRDAIDNLQTVVAGLLNTQDKQCKNTAMRVNQVRGRKAGTKVEQLNERQAAFKALGIKNYLELGA